MVKSVLKTLLVFLISFVFSCKSNKDNYLEILTKQLESSNSFFEENKADLLDEFANLKHDPLRYVNALSIEPLIDTIKKLVNNCNFSIDQFKENLNNKVHLESVLSENKKLKLFLNNALLFYLFNDDKSLEYLKNLQFNLADSSLENKIKSANIQVSKAIIASLKYGINFTAYKFIKYCNYKIALPSCFLGYESFSVFINQNTNHLKKGEELEISTAIKLIEIYSKPKMIVNGKTIKADENGVVKFKTQINKNPGNYNIPFVIEFTKPDGHIRREKKEVKYSVEE